MKSMHTHPSTPTRPPPSWLSRARRLAASAQDHARYWNVTRAEREASYPCDAYGEPAYEPVLRAVDVTVPAAVVFRWLCQLKVAPYSYDLLDDLGRHSPRELTPGAERLGRGQRFLIFELVDFEPDRHPPASRFPRRGSSSVRSRAPTWSRRSATECRLVFPLCRRIAR